LKSAQYYHLKTFQKTRFVFTNFLKKSSKLTHDLATDKLKPYPKIIEKQVCKIKMFKSAKFCKKTSLQIKMNKSAYSKNEQVCKNRKASLQNSAK